MGSGRNPTGARLAQRERRTFWPPQSNFGSRNRGGALIRD